jgi:hypothetical protein
MGKPYFETVDITLTGIFCALWATLNLTLGPLGFAWFGLPIFCDFAVFFTLLLATWATGKYGTASLVGIIGSIIILLTRASPHIVGFAASAVLFDVLMLPSHHRIDGKAHNVIVASLATAISACFAGLIIGAFFTNDPLNQSTLGFALTFWSGWHLIGGVVTIAITLPIIGILERAGVGKIRNARRRESCGNSENGSKNHLNA